MQSTWFDPWWGRSLGPWANKPMCNSYWACTLEATSCDYWAHILQLLKSGALEPMLHKRTPQWSHPPQLENSQAPLTEPRKAMCIRKTQHSHKKINKLNTLVNISYFTSFFHYLTICLYIVYMFEDISLFSSFMSNSYVYFIWYDLAFP